MASSVRVLDPVKHDETVVNSAQHLAKEGEIFEELRDILRFKRPDGKPILRQRPPGSTSKDARQTEERLREFRQHVQTRTPANDPVIARSSNILIDYLEKYSDKLVGHVITLPGSHQVINTAMQTYNPVDGYFKDVYVVEKTGTKQGWAYTSPDEDWFTGYQHEMEAFYRAIAYDESLESDSMLAADTI